MADGKMLFAFDRARNRPPRPATDYFVAAIDTIRANKERYAEAEARIRAQRRFADPTPPCARDVVSADDGEDVP
jgi:hypothetical protein